MPTPPPDPVDFPPGTVRLFDEKQTDVVPELLLFPTPSTHPDDPLNWSTPRKYLSLTCVCLCSMSQGFVTSGLFSIYPQFSEATGIPVDSLNSAIGCMYLLAGWTPLIMTPLSTLYGKRPIYLSTVFIATGIAIWGPFISSTAAWYGQSAILGFTNAPSFATAEASVADVFFAHERALPMAVYIVLLFLGSLLPPLTGAYLAEAFGYRSIFWFNAALLGFTFVFCFLFQEETNYVRAPREEYPLPATEQVYEDDDDPFGKPTVQDRTKIPASAHVVEVEGVRRRPYSARLKLWTRPHVPVLATLRDGVLRPLPYLKSPVLWWGVAQYGFGQVIFNNMNGLSAEILSAAPYNFSATQIGLCYLAPTVMTIVSVVGFGYLSDWFGVWMARRNGGIAEAEHKLWLLAPLVIILPLSMLLSGLGPYYELNWSVYVIGGIATSCAISAIQSVAALTYLFDTFHEFRPPQAADNLDDAPQVLAFLPPTMTIAFALSYAIGPWSANMRTYGITSAIMYLIIMLSIFPYIRWGKSIRRRDGIMLSRSKL